MKRCRWVADASVPGGRYHVPECWGTVHDPHGICHCPPLDGDDEARMDRLERTVASLSAQIQELRS